LPWDLELDYEQAKKIIASRLMELRGKRGVRARKATAYCAVLLAQLGNGSRVSGAVDAHTRQPIWFGVSLTRTTGNALMFLRRLRWRCLGDPVILTDRDPWYRDAILRVGFPNRVHQTFGLRSPMERFFGYLKDRTKAFYNNINPKKTLFAPLVGFLELFMH